MVDCSLNYLQILFDHGDLSFALLRTITQYIHIGSISYEPKRYVCVFNTISNLLKFIKNFRKIHS